MLVRESLTDILAPKSKEEVLETLIGLIEDQEIDLYEIYEMTGETYVKYVLDNDILTPEAIDVEEIFHEPISEELKRKLIDYAVLDTHFEHLVNKVGNDYIISIDDYSEFSYLFEENHFISRNDIQSILAGEIDMYGTVEKEDISLEEFYNDIKKINVTDSYVIEKLRETALNDIRDLEETEYIEKAIKEANFQKLYKIIMEHEDEDVFNETIEILKRTLSNTVSVMYSNKVYNYFVRKIKDFLGITDKDVSVDVYTIKLKVDKDGIIRLFNAYLQGYNYEEIDVFLPDPSYIIEGEEKSMFIEELSSVVEYNTCIKRISNFKSK